MNPLARALTVLCLLWSAGCIMRLSGGPRSHEGLTQITLSGPTGAVVAVSYVQDGTGAVSLTTSLPWRLEAKGVSSFEFRKLRPDDPVVAELHYEAEGIQVASGGRSGPGSHGLTVLVSNGFAVKDF